MTFLADQPLQSEPAPMRLCTQCRHHLEIGSLWRPAHGCGLEECGSKIDPVDGTRFYRVCAAARADGGPCGPDAKYWASKD